MRKLPPTLADALRHASEADRLHLLGLVELQRGRRDAAEQMLRRALAVDPNHFDAHNNLGILLVAQGKISEAIDHYQRALAIKPNDPNAHTNLGIALIEENRAGEAIEHYRQALALDPNHSNAHNNLGIALAAQGQLDEAADHYHRSIELNPKNPNAHNNLGVILADQGKTAEAIGHYHQALALSPDHAEARNNLGNALKSQGEFELARVEYARAAAIRPDYAEALYNLSEIKKFQPGDPEIAVLQALTAKKGAVFAHFALAKALDDCGDVEAAWEQLTRANALRRSQIQYDEARTLRFFTRIQHVFSAKLLDFTRMCGDPSEVPVFVLGMPRSGSTLVEQILSSHPRVTGAGEHKYLETLTATWPGYPECIAGVDRASLRASGEAYLKSLPAGGDRVVDKLPGNFFNIGLIRMILPNARIIHTTRDALDTCVSCYSKLFTAGLDFTYDLGELGRYYRAYRELMQHWRTVLPPGAMLEVAYEDVVEDLEGQARRLVEFCGLEWDDRCVAFHQTRRTVRTASAVQVRQPLFRGSVGRWRRHEGKLGPLIREL